MPPFTLETATPALDGELREVISASSTPGGVGFAQRRFPSFFGAEKIGNIDARTYIGRDRRTGALAGMCSCGQRRIYMGGRAMQVGYLSALRIEVDYRCGMLLPRGAQFVGQQTSDLPWYLASVMEGNDQMASVCEGTSRMMPRTRLLTRLRTLLFSLNGREKGDARGQERVSAAEFLAAWEELAPRRDLSPAVSSQDLQGEGWKGLDAFYVRRSAEGAPVATIAVWDQTALRQCIVTRYSWPLRAGRRAFNAVAPLAGYIAIPAPGEELRLVYGTLLSYRAGHESDFVQLVKDVRERLHGSGFHAFVLAVAADDPAYHDLRRVAAFELKSRVYAFAWEEADLPTNLKEPAPDVATF
jgi:hypothetical protein